MTRNRTLTAVALALVFAATGAYAATEVHHYSFDTNFDDNVGSNDLSTGIGTPNITSTAGQVAFGAGALNLDQSGTEEFLNFTTGLSYDGSAAWSMSWWGQIGSDASDNRTGMIVGTDDDSNDFVWTPDRPSTLQGLRLRGNASGSETTDYAGIPDDNAYHHWAFSYDGAGMVTAWRDGVDLGTKAWTGNIDFDHVGAGTASQVHSFHGQIDELRIMDGELSVDEVASLIANNSLNGLAPNMVTATADTYISSQNDNDNFGSDDTMVANDRATNTRYVFVRFDISALGDAESAKLVLTFSGGSAAAETYEVFGLLDADDDWNEGTLTWNTSTNLSGSDIDLADVYGGASLADFTQPAGSSAGDATVLFDVDSGDILDFLNADADGIVTFVIAETGAVDNSGTIWATLDHTTLAPPKLTIGTVVGGAIPAPAALPAGLALLALTAARRRRRA